MTRVTWKQTVRGAEIRLVSKIKAIEGWRNLWMTPFYAWLRRSVLHKEEAWIVAECKLEALRMRHDRIVRRYSHF
ncbi:hypothetical protein UXJ26_15550 [Burkholderia multivorans]|uniref:hypothetical protein n=2 Tax=Burkholderia multivorans TaxID=87883 RepID=UPI0011B2031B|nr:hypothetical protein [Burkholderia multivorans]ELK7722812.1 hypothetical protein [Burkholderia cenocepacia]MBR8453183.1 hypothetical protein [Burkholderia multivorans]MBU9527211.1 hypothetical protein [Burkholderia multivorans]MCL4647372.1 hypothetical protein [Burkholderia multivorans]UQN90574.1 hypothetical protein L0Y85_30355 [Burkholderia multivorans]